MRMGSLAILSVSLIGFAACGPTYNVPPAAVVSGPHNGSTYRLPDDVGLVEIVNEPEVSDRRSTAPTAIVLYFLQPDAKAAIATPPTEVKLEIDHGRGLVEKLALTSEPKSGDPAGAARFASKPGAYALGSFHMTIAAKIGGQTVTQSFDGSR